MRKRTRPSPPTVRPAAGERGDPQDAGALQGRHGGARLILPNGLNIACRVIDISESGAAIATDQRPEIGTPVTIGKTPGRVVRHLEDGFAIEFMRLQHSDFLEENVTDG